MVCGSEFVVGNLIEVWGLLFVKKDRKSEDGSLKFLNKIVRWDFLDSEVFRRRSDVLE